MNTRVGNAEQLSAALTELEDQYLWDADSAYATAIGIEREARHLGDARLITRAQLVQANMLMRQGDVAAAAKQIWAIHRWAADHDDRVLQARTHLIWANIHRHLGDAAQCLEHAVIAVELLDDNATAYMHVWHRTKLADALGLAGSMEAARARYAQTEELAAELGQPRLLIGVLNNHAYTEHAAGENKRAQEVTDKLQAMALQHGLELDPAAFDTIGSIEIENGNYREAERLLLEAVRRHRVGRYEDADALAEYMLTLARAQRCLQAHDRAQASLDESRELCLERGLGDVLVRVHQEQAELHAARGEYAEAFAEHKIFFAAHNRLHSSQREAQARTRQAMFETTEARQEAERFREQARRDPLTGLHNRRYLDEQVPALLAGHTELTVAIVDLDHFKRINDQLSHDIGDQVLIQVAKLLETELAAVAPDGFAARMGGEEFLLALPGVECAAAAGRLETIRAAVSSYDWSELTHGLPVTVSIGVAGLAEAGERTQAALLSIADRNLYVAKHAGRDRVIAGQHRDGRHRSYRAGATAA
ncbi:diguanylate cyclase [Actinoplanes sp. N902-109]|uniref:GGDEF domain-containing protein n=1 Tax=Actinoplanes sp. (strain N902-109) TaxID=649831 RepID=UPI0003296622|nr:GGDEF domain-containing protein [Actinoplanes sp. N902-109]AGL21514.1 diguanylate cyclase [Actinoplanes sp. N902-109]